MSITLFNGIKQSKSFDSNNKEALKEAWNEMSDERVFATKHMNQPKDSRGDLMIIEDTPNKVFKGGIVYKKKNYRKLLYIFLIPLLFIDWVVTLLANIMELICNSLKSLVLSLETYINNDRKPPEQET